MVEGGQVTLHHRDPVTAGASACGLPPGPWPGPATGRTGHQGRVAPAMPVWAMPGNDFPVATRPSSWGWGRSGGPWPPVLAWRPRLLAATSPKPG